MKEREKRKTREGNNKKENQTRIFNFARNSLLLDRVYHSVCHPWSSNIAKCPSRWITLIIFKPKVPHIWFPYFVFHVSRGLTLHKYHHLCGSRSNFATFKLSFQFVILKQTRQVWQVLKFNLPSLSFATLSFSNNNLRLFRTNRIKLSPVYHSLSRAMMNIYYLFIYLPIMIYYNVFVSRMITRYHLFEMYFNFIFYNYYMLCIMWNT